MSPFVLRALTWVPVALVVAVAMDFWAAILHGRLWHARLWPVHRSHHEPPSGAGRLEANDALSLLHAPIAIGAWSRESASFASRRPAPEGGS